ncbi:MAG: hypothetical protein AB7S75_06030 [Desulfococcaceae bacterium]
MIRKHCFLLSVLFFISMFGTYSASAQSADVCQMVGSDLRLHMPCVEFQDVQYGFDMEYFQNSADPEGIYWKIDLSSLTVKDMPPEQCLPIRNNLKIYAACMEYENIPYRFVLSYAPDADPEALAWKMEISTFSAVPEPPSYGSGYLSIGEESWNTGIAYYTPESLNQTTNPGLMVYLHGDGESSRTALTARLERDFKTVADEKGLVVIAVQANNLGFRLVNEYGKYTYNDYYNTVDAILLAHKTWGVNPYETYVTGYSAGGPGAVLIARSELRPAIRAAVIWCAPFNIYALIPNLYKSQAPVRTVSNTGDPNYSVSFPYWHSYLSQYGHTVEAVTETHISGHQFDGRSVRNAVDWMMQLP